MKKVMIFRTKPRRMDREHFSKLAGHLGIHEKMVETEDAMAAFDKIRAIAYAQPGARFGGLLFFTDQNVSLGELVNKPPDPATVKKWSDTLFREFHLLPDPPGDKRINLRLEMEVSSGSAFVFDGKEREQKPSETTVFSSISLNGITVGGPRARIRMVFKKTEQPALMHCGIWGEIGLHEERTLVEEEEVVKVIKDKLTSRRDLKQRVTVSGIRLSYFADEYRGGPDLLVPFYFVDIEFEDRRSKKMGISQGPRQMFRVPAFR